MLLGRALRKGLSFEGTTGLRTLLRGGASTSSGVRVSPDRATTAQAVYSATGLIAESIGSMPVRFIERDDTARKPVRPPVARALWEKPNPQQFPVHFWESNVLSMLLWGNAYVYPRRTNGGDVRELWPLDPDRITEIESNERPDGSVATRYHVEGLGELVNEPGAPPALIHIPNLTKPGRLKGMSPIEEMAELVGISLSSQQYAGKFLGDGVYLSGVIETTASLDRKQARDLQQGFIADHGGPGKTGSVGVLSGGASFKQLTIPPAQLQFLEQQQMTDRKIAGIYRVPPHMVGDVERSTSWGSGIEEQSIQFVQHTLMPIIRKLESAFEATLLAGTPYEMKFVTQGLLRGDSKSQEAFFRGLWNIGVLSGDDIRALMDMGPLPDGQGQRYYVPVNMMPAGEPAADLESRARLWLALRAEARAE